MRGLSRSPSDECAVLPTIEVRRHKDPERRDSHRVLLQPFQQQHVADGQKHGPDK